MFLVIKIYRLKIVFIEKFYLFIMFVKISRKFEVWFLCFVVMFLFVRSVIFKYLCGKVLLFFLFCLIVGL